MTLANLLGIRFDGAAVVDFTGFQDVVKAARRRRHVRRPAGRERSTSASTSNGNVPCTRGTAARRSCTSRAAASSTHWQALDYVRQRYSLPDGDYGRQRHQQQFLRALLDQARAQGFATNPIKLDRLIRAVGGTLTVDTGGTPLDALVFGLRDVRPSASWASPCRPSRTWIGDISYIVPFEEATDLYEAMVNDTLEAWAEQPAWVNHSEARLAVNVPTRRLPLRSPTTRYLLDVREPDEWAAGHPPGAHHVPMMQIPARAAEVPDRPRRGGRLPGRRALRPGGGLPAAARLGQRRQPRRRDVRLGRGRPADRG